MKCTNCSTVIKPVVVFDIDGTIGNYHDHLRKFCADYWNKRYNYQDAWDGTGDFEDFLGLTRAQYREAKLAFRQGGVKRWMPMYEDASHIINSLRMNGAELWIATTRPWQRLDNVDPDTREWLRRNNIDYDGLLYGENKYEQIIEHVDQSRIVAVVDDLTEQCEKAFRLGLPIIHRWNFHNEKTFRYAGSGDLFEIYEMIIERMEQWQTNKQKN